MSEILTLKKAIEELDCTSILRVCTCCLGCEVCDGAMSCSCDYLVFDSYEVDLETNTITIKTTKMKKGNYEKTS